LLTKSQALQQQAIAGAKGAGEYPEPETEQVNQNGKVTKVIGDGILIPTPTLLISKPDGIVENDSGFEAKNQEMPWPGESAADYQLFLLVQVLPEASHYLADLKTLVKSQRESELLRLKSSRPRDAG